MADDPKPEDYGLIGLEYQFKSQWDNMLRDGIPNTFHRMNSPFYEGERWAVMHGTELCLNVSAEWEWQPLPSSRDDAFYERCRFKTLAQAMDAYRKRMSAESRQVSSDRSSETEKER